MILKSPVKEVVLVHLSVVAGSLVAGSILAQMSIAIHVLYFISGLVLYSLAEYLIHRYFLHSSVVEKMLGRSRISHLVHHERPRDMQRLDLDLWPSMVLISAFLLLFCVVLGYVGFTAFSGFLAGYIGYELVHYSVHFSRPPGNRLKRLWAHHAYHHFADHTRAYGVTSPIWDLVFGTMPKRHSHGKCAT